MPEKTGDKRPSYCNVLFRSVSYCIVSCWVVMYFIASPSAHLYHIVGIGLLEVLKQYKAALSSYRVIEATGREIVFLREGMNLCM